MHRRCLLTAANISSSYGMAPVAMVVQQEVAAIGSQPAILQPCETDSIAFPHFGSTLSYGNSGDIFLSVKLKKKHKASLHIAKSCRQMMINTRWCTSTPLAARGAKHDSVFEKKVTNGNIYHRCCNHGLQRSQAQQQAPHRLRRPSGSR